MVALALSNKQLVIFDSQFNVLINTMCKRAVSKITFTVENDLLIADKTGDVLVYKFKNNEEQQLLLGHLSMLLDIVVSDCGKYVITSDRDEKIRVSCYPNSYNIVSFCLGHVEFVTNLQVCGSLLISGSGDGTVRFWDFITGKQLEVLNTNDNVVDKSVITKFCNEMDSENVDITTLPITDLQICKSADINYLGVTLFGVNSVQLYSFEFNEALKFEFVENIIVPDLLSFCLSAQLVIISKNDVLVYNLSTKEMMSDVKCFESIKHLLHDYVNQSQISSLYKRKYDNVQEYLEKKKLRLQNKA